MKLIIGLGNPGEKYKKTRHNIGFILLDFLAKEFGVEFKTESKFNSEITEIIWKREKIILGKPKNFMNNSGEAVLKIANYYKIDPKNILVIHDEIDLPFGDIRSAFDSSSAGHKGVQSIVNYLGTQEFHRVRFGVQNENNQLPTEIFVLKEFSKEEFSTIKKIDTEEFLKILN